MLGSFDFIVVGGGSAGCVLANRLSARSANEVLLVEAGPDTPPWRVPDEILASYPGVVYFDPKYTWTGLKVFPHPPPGDNGSTVRTVTSYEQAKVLGGGSSINGQMALRGTVADYDDWESLGAKGWNWENVLPYFKKLERDMDFDGPAHGSDGPVPLSRMFPEHWSGMSRAAASAFAEAGYTFIEDINLGAADGYYPVPSTNAYQRRVSTAMAYLDATTRARANLTIMTSAQVTRLLIDGIRVIGVEVIVGGRFATASAATVIISGGAIHSPALLMRAGIGDADHLKEHAIEVVAHRPGVGENLCDHPMTAISAFLPRSARLNPPLTRHAQISLRYSSGLKDCPDSDMLINVLQRSGWHPLGERLGSLSICLNKPHSRGTVRLRSADWDEQPEIEFNLCGDPRDLERMKGGYRMACEMLQNEDLRANFLDPFPSSYSERVRKIGRVSRTNYLLTGILAGLFETSSLMRQFLTRNVITMGSTLNGLLANDTELETYLRGSVTGDWHATGTCRMGAEEDSLAVTDSEGRVYGIEGLRVVDASLMPDIPAANTNIPTIMIAEKISDAILNPG